MEWLKETIAKVVALFTDTVTAVVKWIAKLFENIFKAIWDVLTDIVCWILDKLMDIVVAAANALDVSGLMGFSVGSDLPSEIINVMQLCGVGTAVGIITAAIGIRLVLQLIPFSRLGS